MVSPPCPPSTSNGCTLGIAAFKRSTEQNGLVSSLMMQLLNCNSGLLVLFRGCLEGELVLNGANSIFSPSRQVEDLGGTGAFQK